MSISLNYFTSAEIPNQILILIVAVAGVIVANIVRAPYRRGGEDLAKVEAELSLQRVLDYAGFASRPCADHRL